MKNNNVENLIKAIINEDGDRMRTLQMIRHSSLSADNEIEELKQEVDRLRILFKQYCNSSIDADGLLYPFHDIDTEQFS